MVNDGLLCNENSKQLVVNSSYFPKSSFSGEIFSVTKLNLLQNGGCSNNVEHVAGRKADIFSSFCTLPAFDVLDSGHQLSHPLTMFHSLSMALSIYAEFISAKPRQTFST